VEKECIVLLYCSAVSHDVLYSIIFKTRSYKEINSHDIMDVTAKFMTMMIANNLFDDNLDAWPNAISEHGIMVWI
jgi:hypothetical protein